MPVPANHCRDMLINSIEQIRTVVPVNGTAGFETFSPYLDAAEEQFIIPLLGIELYTELAAIAANAGTDPQKALLKKVHYSLVHLAMWSGFDMLNVTFDDSGFERVSKEKGLYRYQEENLKVVFKKQGYNGMDGILEYLMLNIASFEKFKSSAFYVEMKGSFFPTTSVFNAIYGIGNSRLIFLQIDRFFEPVIDFEIVPLLGRALFDKVVAEMKKEGEKNPDLMALVSYIRKPLAYLAVASGIDEVGIQLTEKGLFFETQVGTNASHIETVPANVENIRNKALVNGKRYKDVLLNYLKANADKYPDFTQTDLTNTNPFRRDNTGKKTFWA